MKAWFFNHSHWNLLGGGHPNLAEVEKDGRLLLSKKVQSSIGTPPNNQIVLNKQAILGKAGVKAWEAVWRLENAKPSHLSNWLSGVSAQMWRSECFFRDKITYIESFRLSKTVQVKGWEEFILFTLFCITSIHTPSFRPVVIIGEVRLTTRRLFRTTRRVGKTNQGVVRTSRRVVKPCAPYS